MRHTVHLPRVVFRQIGNLFQQILQTLRYLREFMVTFGTFRIPTPKLLVNEALHGGNISVFVAHPTANETTTACDRDRCFHFAKGASYLWRRLTMPMLTVIDSVFHCLSFFLKNGTWEYA